VIRRVSKECLGEKEGRLWVVAGTVVKKWRKTERKNSIAWKRLLDLAFYNFREKGKDEADKEAEKVLGPHIGRAKESGLFCKGMVELPVHL